LTFTTLFEHVESPGGLRSGYNFISEVMSSLRYALVTYIRNPVGEFVEQLRQELHPTTVHLAAHLSILPPRELKGTEAAALEFLSEACRHVVPFTVELGDVETFLPTTSTVFIAVKQSASRMRELHDQLCSRGLRCHEIWPYTPHLTIVKTDRDEQARAAYLIAHQRWAKFPGKREVPVEELMFVRERDGCWQDVAPVPLGRDQLSSKL
jgi:2'-5' RNA ligase